MFNLISNSISTDQASRGVFPQGVWEQTGLITQVCGKQQGDFHSGVSIGCVVGRRFVRFSLGFGFQRGVSTRVV